MYVTTVQHDDGIEFIYVDVSLSEERGGVFHCFPPPEILHQVSTYTRHTGLKQNNFDQTFLIRILHSAGVQLANSHVVRVFCEGQKEAL
jgi:hypothetical protein